MEKQVQAAARVRHHGNGGNKPVFSFISHTPIMINKKKIIIITNTNNNRCHEKLALAAAHRGPRLPT